MIDLSIYNNLDPLTGVLDSYITEPKYSTNFQIIRWPQRNWWVLSSKTNNFSSENNIIYSDDDLRSITGYYKELLNINFDSILVVGLGIGIVPHVIKYRSTCSTVDVLEINQEMIDLVESIGYLEGVNIINANIFNYIPTKNYDIILLDIWQCDCNNFITERDTLITKYLPNLNPGGFIYTPINANLGETKFQN
jgi:trans-aconitate methyltransferase